MPEHMQPFSHVYLATGVALKSYKVIYELIDDIRALMEGRLDAVEDRTLIGEAEVRAVFGTGNKKVAGCMVTDGKLKRDSMAVVSPVWSIPILIAIHWHPSIYFLYDTK